MSPSTSEKAGIIVVGLCKAASVAVAGAATAAASGNVVAALTGTIDAFRAFQAVRTEAGETTEAIARLEGLADRQLATLESFKSAWQTLIAIYPGMQEEGVAVSIIQTLKILNNVLDDIIDLVRPALRQKCGFLFGIKQACFGAGMEGDAKDLSKKLESRREEFSSHLLVVQQATDKHKTLRGLRTQIQACKNHIASSEETLRDHAKLPAKSKAKQGLESDIANSERTLARLEAQLAEATAA